jgi:hypothetical protein
MAFKEVSNLDADVTVAIGGINKKTNKANPTKLEGYYIGSKTVQSAKSKTGTAQIHILQTPTGNVGVWGKTSLDQKMLAVTKGSMIRISFAGMQKVPGKNDMYKYKVEEDTENSIEVVEEAGANLGDQSYEDDVELAAYDPDLEETPLDEDEAQLDETPPARPTRSAQQAPTPDAARAAKVQALLNNKGKAQARR